MLFHTPAFHVTFNFLLIFLCFISILQLPSAYCLKLDDA